MTRILAWSRKLASSQDMYVLQSDGWIQSELRPSSGAPCTVTTVAHDYLFLALALEKLKD